MRLACVAAVLALGLGGCGGGHATSDAGGGAGGGGAGSGGAGSGGGSGDGGACGNVRPPPSPTLPSGPGCYTKTDAGWIEQPCNCEMPLDNVTHASADVRIVLTVDPAGVMPSLTGAPAMQITFEDPDAGWFAVWSAQPGAGTAFAVTNAAGSTVVRLGASRVELAVVPLPACASRMGMGDVGRTANVILDMEASLTSGGAVVGTAVGACQFFMPP